VSLELRAGPSLPIHTVRPIVRRALDEDMPWGDITSESLIPAEAQAIGRFVTKEGGVICGLAVASLAFSELDDRLRFEALVSDGYRSEPGETFAEVRGAARSILSGERTALNLIQRMSGVATTTAQYVEAISGTSATIVDTRKTAPGLRLLDKYAVRCGGGLNHRFSLSDAVLVKDNHLEAIEGLSPGSSSARLQELREVVPHTVKIEVEVENLDQLEKVLAAKPDVILLDNMSLDEMRRAVELVGGRSTTEASGGITLATVKDVALTGIDLISVGALTHSVRALDISLEMRLQSPAPVREWLECPSEPQRVGEA
jgi:nicotinate-nucleotide pyrophosphorylase (carboxylating)